MELLSESTAAMERALSSETEKTAAQVIQITLIAGLPCTLHYLKNIKSTLRPLCQVAVPTSEALHVTLIC